MTNELTDDELREAIVRHEWDQFQRTNNERGRAACQGNWPVFHQMRLAQFLTWERPFLTSYAADLDAAFINQFFCSAAGAHALVREYFLDPLFCHGVPFQYQGNIRRVDLLI